MTNRRIAVTTLGCALALSGYTVAATAQEAPRSSVKPVSSRFSLAGTSNIHAYTASTTAARIVRLQVANGAPLQLAGREDVKMIEHLKAEIQARARGPLN